MSQPGETAEGHTDDRLVSTGLDLLPTLCEYAGIDAPEGLRGRSVRDAAAGAGVDEWREYVVSEIVNARSGGGKREFEARMLRTEQYKYVVYEWGENREQLFDLENDPGELVDLSVDADHADVLAAHHERLLQWCVETDDTFGSRYTEPDLPRIPGYDAAEIETRLSETENVRQSEG